MNDVQPDIQMTRAHFLFPRTWSSMNQPGRCFAVIIAWTGTCVMIPPQWFVVIVVIVCNFLVVFVEAVTIDAFARWNVQAQLKQVLNCWDTTTNGARRKTQQSNQNWNSMISIKVTLILNQLMLTNWFHLNQIVKHFCSDYCLSNQSTLTASDPVSKQTNVAAMSVFTGNVKPITCKSVKMMNFQMIIIDLVNAWLMGWCPSLWRQF